MYIECAQVKVTVMMCFNLRSTGFIRLIIYQLWYLIEEIKIGVTGKFRERNLKVYLNTEVGDLIFGEEDCLETLTPKMVSPVINMIFRHVNLTEKRNITETFETLPKILV